MEGVGGRKFFVREPSATPRRPVRSEQSRAEKLPSHFLFLRAPTFLLKEKVIFLRGSAAWRHGGGAERLDFFKNFC
jgi:hypothetical protein